MEKAAELLLNYGVLGVLCLGFAFVFWKAGKGIVNWFFIKYEAQREEEKRHREEMEKLKETALQKTLDENAKRFEAITNKLQAMHEDSKQRDQQTELEKREWAGKVFEQIKQIANGLTDLANTVRDHDVSIKLLSSTCEKLEQEQSRHAREIEKILKHINV